MLRRGAHRGVFALAAFAAVAILASPARATMPPKLGVEPTAAQKVLLDKMIRTPVQAGLTAKVARAAAARAAAEKGIAVSPAMLSVSGTTRVPVILTKYSNTGSPPYASANLQTGLFNGPSATGTMTEYYDEVSYGALNVTGAVYDWVSLPNPDTYYEGGCNGLCGSGKVKDLITYSLSALDPSVNFGQYDNDGPDGVANSGDDDGWADFVAFVHPETGGECGGSNIWSHRYKLSSWGVPGGYTTNDARAGGGFIKINDYTIQPAKSCYTGGMIEIGVFCHEFGHAFGLPDLYDTDNSSQGAGNWDVMAGGGYGGDGAHPARPSHFSAWAKSYMGWLTPGTVTATSNGVQVPRAETNPTAFKIPFGSPTNAKEYFLVENRQQTGFDQYLRAGGLLIWHIDDAKWTSLTLSNNANTQECQDGPGKALCGAAHYTVALEQADGQNHLEKGTNRADSGDPFRAGYNATFNAASTPWSKDYAAVSTAIPTITNISASGATMTMNVTIPGTSQPPCRPTAPDSLTGDFNGDGKADILWRNTSTGRFSIWLMNGLSVLAGDNVATPALAWGLSATGDFDGDGNDDVLWRNSSTGGMYIYLMNGLQVKQAAIPATPSLALQVAGVDDFDGDGKDDIAWRNASSGALVIWLMNGLATKSIAVVAKPAVKWTLETVGDFDADGKADIAWRHSVDGRLWIWLMNGVTLKSANTPATPSLAWVLYGAEDFDGDGKADLLWRDPSTGTVTIYYMSGHNIAAIRAIATPTLDWEAVAPADFDGDGMSDILWYKASTDVSLVWLMTGTKTKAIGPIGQSCATPATAPGAEEAVPLAACADADGDGWADCGGDCDDFDAGANPAALESLGDGLDNNCNGLADEETLCGVLASAGGSPGSALVLLLPLVAVRLIRRRRP